MNNQYQLLSANGGILANRVINNVLSRTYVRENQNITLFSVNYSCFFTTNAKCPQ